MHRIRRRQRTQAPFKELTCGKISELRHKMADLWGKTVKTRKEHGFTAYRSERGRGPWKIMQTCVGGECMLAWDWCAPKLTGEFTFHTHPLPLPEERRSRIVRETLKVPSKSDWASAMLLGDKVFCLAHSVNSGKDALLRCWNVPERGRNLANIALEGTEFEIKTVKRKKIVHCKIPTYVEDYAKELETASIYDIFGGDYRVMMRYFPEDITPKHKLDKLRQDVKPFCVFPLDKWTLAR